MRILVLIIVVLFNNLAFADVVIDGVYVSTDDHDLGYRGVESIPENSLWPQEEATFSEIILKIFAIFGISFSISLLVRHYTKNNIKSYVATSGLVVFGFYLIDTLFTYAQFTPVLNQILWLIILSFIGEGIAHLFYLKFSRLFAKYLPKY